MTDGWYEVPEYPDQVLKVYRVGKHIRARLYPCPDGESVGDPFHVNEKMIRGSKNIKGPLVGRQQITGVTPLMPTACPKCHIEISSMLMWIDGAQCPECDHVLYKKDA